MIAWERRAEEIGVFALGVGHCPFWRVDSASLDGALVLTADFRSVEQKFCMSAAY